MRARRWLVSLIVVAAGASRVHAQSASVQAQSLFDDGQRLMQAGKLAEACAAFESSQKLDPAVTTLLNLADCREQNHQLATAWGTFVDANRMARTSNNDKLARVATTHAHKLEPRLSKLTISVPADHQVPGLEVQRGTDRVDPAGWNHALPIDGGTYTITARAPGHAPWSVKRTIKVESDVQTIEIPKLLDARSSGVAAARPDGAAAPPPAAAPVVPAGNAGAASSARPSGGSSGGASSAGSAGVASAAKPSAGNSAGARPVTPAVAGGTGESSAGAGAGRPGTGSADAPRSSVADASPALDATPAVDHPEAGHSVRRYVWPIGFGVAALATGGAALGFKISGDNRYNEALELNKQAASDPAARAHADADYQQANTRRYLAEGFAVAAVGCAGAAVYLYVRSRGDSRAEATVMTPVASPQLTGLAVVGSW